MATYTAIPNSDIETDKPIRAVTGRALRDNPIAIAEGASGAPKVETLGLTPSERMQINNIIAQYSGKSNSPTGAVGTGVNQSRSKIRQITGSVGSNGLNVWDDCHFFYVAAAEAGQIYLNFDLIRGTQYLNHGARVLVNGLVVQNFITGAISYTLAVSPGDFVQLQLIGDTTGSTRAPSSIDNLVIYATRYIWLI